MKTGLNSIPPHHHRACALLDDLSHRTLRKKPSAWEQTFLASVQRLVADGGTVTRRQWEVLRGLHERLVGL